MIDIASYWAALQSARPSGVRALLLGLATFVLLWIFSIPYRAAYVPNGGDIPALADGLLLAPGAHWLDWFTRGYSDFWDRYPEWPLQVTGFTRPLFQFAIYLAHFALGRDWASYQVINCFAVAGLAAVAFQIAQVALGRRPGLSLLAAILVVLSPPVLQSWLFGLAFAIEPLATLFAAGAFLAVVARRDFLCLLFLFAALLTKENTVWAPLAAAITIMLRPKSDEPLRRRTITAAMMFLPVVMWLSLRFISFDGIGGTYATIGYTPLEDFLNLTFYKLTHLDFVLVSSTSATEWNWTLLDKAIRIGARILIYVLLGLWTLRVLLETLSWLRFALHAKAWPTMNPPLLVALWAGLALAFHLALPILAERYATSVCVFVWPALVAEVEKRRNAIVWLGLAVCSVVILARSSYFTVDWGLRTVRNNYEFMNAALREAPATTRQIYVLPASESLQDGNPKYVRLILDVSPEIVRIVDIDWKCDKPDNVVVFNHSIADGVVNLTVNLPDCANFRFINAHFANSALTNGHLYRNAAISYELPDAYPIGPEVWQPPFYLGRKMTVHVRPRGPARFIIDRGEPNGIAWFDTP